MQPNLADKFKCYVCAIVCLHARVVSRLAVADEDQLWVHQCRCSDLLLACRLAQAKKDMAELNSRLVNAAFGNAFSGALPESFMPSLSGMDYVESSSQLDRQSSNPASEEQNSIAGLPPGVPLDPLYDE